MRRADRAFATGLGLIVCFGFTPAHAAQEAAPQKHDNAEARHLLAQAEQAAARISDKDDKIKTLENIALAKADAGDYDGARLIARALGTNESKAKILREMAVQQALGGDPKTAVNTVGGIAAGEDKVSAYCAIADSLVDAHDKLTALAVMSHTADVKYTDDGKAVQALISIGFIFAKAGAPEATSAMATHSTETGPLWNDINATLLVIAKAYNHDTAGARAKCGVIHEAFFKMLALIFLGEAQHDLGDKKSAGATYKEVLTLCVTLPKSEKIVLDVAHEQYKNGDTADSQATIHALLDSVRNKDADDLLGEIADQQAEDGDVEGAQKTLAFIKKPGNQAAVWNGLAFAKAKTGDVTGALAIAPKDSDPAGQAQVLLGTARGILKALKPDDKP